MFRRTAKMIVRHVDAVEIKFANLDPIKIAKSTKSYRFKSKPKQILQQQMILSFGTNFHVLHVLLLSSGREKFFAFFA